MSNQADFDDKLNSLGFMACGLAHDIGNFITAIAVTANMLKSRHPNDTVTQLHCDRIGLACEKVSGLAQSIINFIKSTPSPVDSFCLNQIVKEVGLLLETLKVSIQTDLEPELKPIRGNRSLVYVALMNLCVNAAQAMQDSGSIRISTRNLSLGTQPGVGIRIADDGVGMAEEVAARAFDPLFTRRPDGQGTGMGLAVVQRILREHRGEIHLDSTPGKGTTVEVIFPASK